MSDERERLQTLRMLLTVAEGPYRFIELVQPRATHHEAIAAVEAEYAVTEGLARAALGAPFRYVTHEQIDRLRAEIDELEQRLLRE